MVVGGSVHMEQLAGLGPRRRVANSKDKIQQESILLRGGNSQPVTCESSSPLGSYIRKIHSYQAFLNVVKNTFMQAVGLGGAHVTLQRNAWLKVRNDRWPPACPLSSLDPPCSGCPSLTLFRCDLKNPIPQLKVREATWASGQIIGLGTWVLLLPLVASHATMDESFCLCSPSRSSTVLSIQTKIFGQIDHLCLSVHQQFFLCICEAIALSGENIKLLLKFGQFPIFRLTSDMILSLSVMEG